MGPNKRVWNSAPFGAKRMKPLPNGRINPKGIPCLYVATDGEGRIKLRDMDRYSKRS
jgi:hypothetical protein